MLNLKDYVTANGINASTVTDWALVIEDTIAAEGKYGEVVIPRPSAFSLSSYKLATTIDITDPIRLRGEGVTNWEGGCVFRPIAGITALHLKTAKHIVVEGLAFIGTRAASPSMVIVESNSATLRDITIRKNGGHGIEVRGYKRNGTNANRTLLDRVTVKDCGVLPTPTEPSPPVAYGIWFHGGNANDGVVRQGNVTGCTGDHFRDESFLGNSHENCHSSGSKGHAYAALKNSTRAAFYRCYSEGSDPVVLKGKATWLFGQSGPQTGGFRIHEGEIFGATLVRVTLRALRGVLFDDGLIALIKHSLLPSKRYQIKEVGTSQANANVEASYAGTHAAARIGVNGSWWNRP